MHLDRSIFWMAGHRHQLAAEKSLKGNKQLAGDLIGAYSGVYKGIHTQDLMDGN